MTTKFTIHNTSISWQSDSSLSGETTLFVKDSTSGPYTQCGRASRIRYCREVGYINTLQMIDTAEIKHLSITCLQNLSISFEMSYKELLNALKSFTPNSINGQGLKTAKNHFASWATAIAFGISKWPLLVMYICYKRGLPLYACTRMLPVPYTGVFSCLTGRAFFNSLGNGLQSVLSSLSHSHCTSTRYSKNRHTDSRQRFRGTIHPDTVTSWYSLHKMWTIKSSLKFKKRDLGTCMCTQV